MAKVVNRLSQFFCSQKAIPFLIFLIALFLRLWALDIKPPHFDEGINGWFADRIRQQGFYAYDPTNYHGPLYFYVLFVFQTLLGRNLWALRLPAVIGSLASVCLAFRWDRFIGKKAALLGGLALAVSPAAVFYGRYSIHESSVAFSLMLLAWGLLGLAQSGDKRSLWSAFLGGTLLLLLKETAVIHLGCFILALGVLLIWEKVVPSTSLCLGTQKWRRQDIIKASFLSLVMLFFFYSGTFFNCRGLLTVFETIPAWIHTGMGAGGHEKTEYQWWGMNFYWLALMLRYEWPSCLGFLYAGRLLGKKTVAVSRYLAIYSLGVLLAYSLIRYKTPWCLISILWPFALFFGMCCQELLQLCSSFCKDSLARYCVKGVIIFLLLGSFISCLRLNFWNYTDSSEPYVYVQTSLEIEKVVAPLLFMAKKDPLYYHLNGQILLSSYYPLPWILGDFTSIGYFSQEKKPSYFNGDFICIELSRSQEIEKQLKEVYYREEFELRDGMEQCVVYFKKRIFYPYFEKSNLSSRKPIL